jgi:adenosylcobinamide kinase/adenosylcobinamide-phosphate guanylyltransferase
MDAAVAERTTVVGAILVGGGSRSGKSRFALELARARGKRLGFIATAQAFDDEMRGRIDAHKRERGPDFETMEEPVDLVAALEMSRGFDVMVIDCLTLWISNLMMSDRAVPIEALMDAVCRDGLLAILVTNEVGCGIVPENELARRFRDAAGHVNQVAASRAQEVYWMAFGIPLRLK